MRENLPVFTKSNVRGPICGAGPNLLERDFAVVPLMSTGEIRTEVARCRLQRVSVKSPLQLGIAEDM